MLFRSRLAEGFVAGGRCAVVLGDNLVERAIGPALEAFLAQQHGARILLKEVSDPERFGVAEVRAGINTRNIAISGDGRTVAVANYLPHTLVLLDARDLTPLEVIPVRDRGKSKSSRVSAVYQAAPRNSFVVALKDLPEIWEVFPPVTRESTRSGTGPLVMKVAISPVWTLNSSKLKKRLPPSWAPSWSWIR
mgnify:CR=1 FL=1